MRRVTCPDCKGQKWTWRQVKGVQKKFTCGRCNGTGKISVTKPK